MAHRFVVIAAALMCTTCTDAGLYATEGLGPNAPDRAVFQGTACVPVASGEQFPVKVLFAIQGGEGVPRDVVGQVTEALGGLSQTYITPHTTFSLVAFHSVATGIQGAFVDATTLQQSIGRYNAYQEQGPISIRSALRLSRSLISGDAQTSCKGLVARTRYVVVLLVLSADTSCANQGFNAGINPRCNAVLDGGTGAAADAACSECELSEVTAEIKALSDRLDIGEIVVQPIYVATTPDPLVAAQVAAIARAGGTQVKQVDPTNVRNTLGSLDFSSLQRRLTLKRLIAVNRNAISRNGETLLDSDADGLPDADEDAIGTDKLLADTDGDLLMDGLEVKTGLRPQAGNVDIINGCLAKDSDFDRLSDCEERVLGTDSCVSDTDGDGLPDLVELLASTNPLVAEDLSDDDRDGYTNIDEVQAHTDPLSADIAFRNERGYQYTAVETEPTPDGRACYDIRAYNISLVTPERRPNDPFPAIRRGTNDLYLYMQVGRDNDPRGTGVVSLIVRQVVYDPPNRRRPAGALDFVNDEFVVGN